VAEFSNLIEQLEGREGGRCPGLRFGPFSLAAALVLSYSETMFYLVSEII
jgi:hypothetical protein